MHKVLLAVFGPTHEIEAALNRPSTIDVLACPAGVDDLAVLDARYDAIVVTFDDADHPWEERDARRRAIDWVNLNLAHRLKGGACPLWL